MDENTFKPLSIMVIQKGTNLKNYIEGLLKEIAEDYEDAKIYVKLSNEHPEGKIMLNEQKKADFEKWLDVWRLILSKTLRNFLS